jgi:sterol desaturase/sphingolipid hydroxylase (fatty acid hydroxylase superfamily)
MIITRANVQVHSLHHKSYNPTAFSGTNMHPVESTLYYSAALIPGKYLSTNQKRTTIVNDQ